MSAPNFLDSALTAADALYSPAALAESPTVAEPTTDTDEATDEAVLAAGEEAVEAEVEDDGGELGDDHFFRLVKNAFKRGDEKAIERIKQSRYGREALTVIEESTARITEAEVERQVEGRMISATAYAALEERRKLDRFEFQDFLDANPAQAEFYDGYREWMRSRARGMAPASPVMAALTEYHKKLTARPEAKGLSSLDMDALDPDKFARFTDPDDAKEAMRDKLRELTSKKRPTATVTDPRQQGENVRNALRNSPPIVGGAPATATNYADLERQYIEAKQNGTLGSALDYAYQQAYLRKTRGSESFV